MGPTNVALVKLYQADQTLREAQARLDAATKNVRIQERRVKDLTDRVTAAQTKLRESQSRAGVLELDLRTRDAHIERLRSQQSSAKNNKEYQAFLVEINTQKLDKGKVEEETMRVMESVEKGQAELKELNAQLDGEKTELQQLKQQIGERVAQLQAEIDALKPAREQAAAAVPKQARDAFERLAEHHEGEAMAAIARPDRRREEYLCTACNMDLVTDVYNKLHTRDELIFCPSCRRMLYIPEDLPPEVAVNRPKEPKAPRKEKEPKEGSVGGRRRGPAIAAAIGRQSSAVDILRSMQGGEDEPETPAAPGAQPAEGARDDATAAPDEPRGADTSSPDQPNRTDAPAPGATGG